MVCSAVCMKAYVLLKGGGFAVSVGLPEQLLLDPVFVLRDLDVHPRDVSLPAPDAPGDDSGQLPEAGPGLLADQGTPAVALARVLPLLTSGAHEAVVEGEVEAQLGVLEHPLASAKVPLTCSVEKAQTSDNAVKQLVSTSRF